MLYSLLNSSETLTTLRGKGCEDSSCMPVFSTLPETNILNVVKVGKESFLHVFKERSRTILVLFLMVL
jgi:hypothetical protein